MDHYQQLPLTSQRDAAAQLKLGAHRACDCVIAAARLFARTQMSVCTGDRSHLVLASRGAVGIARIKMI